MHSHACGNECKREHVTNGLPLPYTLFQQAETNFELSDQFNKASVKPICLGALTENTKLVLKNICKTNKNETNTLLRYLKAQLSYTEEQVVFNPMTPAKVSTVAVKV